MIELPSAEYLREILDYDPDTGVLRWKVNRGMRGRVGARAGFLDPQGYRKIGLDHEYYFTHRLIFKMMTGRDPNAEVDHINCSRDDNAWVNLREATDAGNAHNASLRKDNKTGYKGVGWHKKNRCWIAYIGANGEQRYLGSFDTAKEAHYAYCRAAEQLHGEFARFE